MSYPMFLDPEVRRVLLEEIAHQRHERSRFRAMTGSHWQEWADGRNIAIRAIRDVWDRLVAVERRRAEDGLAADPINGAWLAGVGDLSDWAPGELQEAFGS